MYELSKYIVVAVLLVGLPLGATVGSVQNFLDDLQVYADSDNKLPYKEDFMEKLTGQYGDSVNIISWDEQKYGVVYVAIEENDKTHIGVWDYLDKWWFESVEEYKGTEVGVD